MSVYRLYFFVTYLTVIVYKNVTNLNFFDIEYLFLSFVSRSVSQFKDKLTKFPKLILRKNRRKTKFTDISL